MRVDRERVAAGRGALPRRPRRRPRTARVRPRNRIRRAATARGWPGATTALRAARRAGSPSTLAPAIVAVARVQPSASSSSASRYSRPLPQLAKNFMSELRRQGGECLGAGLDVRGQAMAVVDHQQARAARLRPRDDIDRGNQFVVPAMDDRWSARARHRSGCASCKLDRRRHQEQARAPAPAATRGREIQAPRLDPASTSGPCAAASLAMRSKRCTRAATSPSSLTSRFASRSV